MTYGYGRGIGFRGASLGRSPYIGRGRGGLPRWWKPTGDEELGIQKNQADAIKQQLEKIENRIEVLEEGK